MTNLNYLAGVGRSKKLAKRQAAHKMVQKILTIPAEDENAYKNLEDEDEVNYGVSTLLMCRVMHLPHCRMLWSLCCRL